MRRFISQLQEMSKKGEFDVSLRIAKSDTGLLKMLVYLNTPDGQRYGKGVAITSDEWENIFMEFETLMTKLLTDTAEALLEAVEEGGDAVS